MKNGFQVNIRRWEEGFWRTRISPRLLMTRIISSRMTSLRFVLISLIGCGSQNSGPETLSSSPECVNMLCFMASGMTITVKSQVANQPYPKVKRLSCLFRCTQYNHKGPSVGKKGSEGHNQGDGCMRRTRRTTAGFEGEGGGQPLAVGKQENRWSP